MPQRVVMLGPPCIEATSAWVELVLGKTAVLLLHLAYQATPVSRDTLLYFLWPEVPEGQARRNLRQLLAAIRRLPYTRTLAVEETRLVWPVETDVAQFRGALTQHNWLKANQLYGGELLQGFSVAGLGEFDFWLEEERQELATLWCDAALRYARELSAAGRPQRAADVLATRLHHADRLDEEVLRALLESLYAGDQWGRASEVHGAFRRYLAAEVDGEPETATLRLAERLRHVEADASEAEAVNGAASATANRDKAASGVQPNRQRQLGPTPERLVGPLENSRARFFKGRAAPLNTLRPPSMRTSG